MKREKLIAFRGKNTQAEMAERYGVTQQAYAKWELGTAVPRPAIMKRIEDESGIDMKDMFKDAFFQCSLEFDDDGLDQIEMPMEEETESGEGFFYYPRLGSLKQRRKSLGMSQQDVADAVNVSRVAIVQWEQGKNTPRMKYIKALAQALKCNPQDLFPNIAADESEDERIEPQYKDVSEDDNKHNANLMAKRNRYVLNHLLERIMQIEADKAKEQRETRIKRISKVVNYIVEMGDFSDYPLPEIEGKTSEEIFEYIRKNQRR